MRLGIACPLPPAPTGPATYSARLLPALSALADIECLTEDPAAVAPELRDRWTIRRLEERWSREYDMVIYHVANNPWHEAVVKAAVDGPPGLLVLHDASIHHLTAQRLLCSGNFDAYTSMLGDAHGATGVELGRLRKWGGTSVELFLFTMLRPIIDRSLGVVVHSRHAATIAEASAPGAPVFVVPHFAMRPDSVASPPSDDDRRVVIGHFGFVTIPKRYQLLCEAVASLLDEGLDVQLVFVGADHSDGDLDATVARLGIGERVRCTGWLEDSDFDRELRSIDIAVSLRWPHVGETSGTLASLLAAGRPVVAERVGSWLEVPDGVVAPMPSTGTRDDDARRDLAAALRPLVVDRNLRETLGSKAARWAAATLDPDRCAGLIVDAARTVAAHTIPPDNIVRGRAAAVADFLAGGEERLGEALGVGRSAVAELITRGHLRRYHTALSRVPPARPGQRLLDVGTFAPLLRLFHEVWGYEVSGVCRPDPLRPGPRRVDVPAGGGLPAVEVAIHPGDLQRDPLPLAPGSVDVVICWEVLEHLGRDPMHLLVEINRVLKPTGVLHLTTPNAACARAVEKVLAGGPAAVWTDFLLTGGDDRHNREYSPAEVRLLLRAAGLADDDVTTVASWDDAPEDTIAALGSLNALVRDRDDNIVAIARKAGPCLERYPAGFYS